MTAGGRPSSRAWIRELMPHLGVRLTLALLTITLSVLSIECGLRTFGPTLLAGNHLPFIFGPNYRYLERHPIYGTFHISNTSSWLWSNEYMTRVDINSQGLREREIPYEKPPAVRRVVVLGDSFVEAQQVAAEAVFTRRLESLLNLSDDETVQVVNAGVTGFGTGQEYLLLEHEALRYQPDLIVLVAYLENDIGENSYRFYGGANRPYFVFGEDGALLQSPFQYEPRRDRGWVDRMLRESVIVSRLDAAYAQLVKDGRDAYRRLEGVVRGSSLPTGQALRTERSVYAELLSVFSDRPTAEHEEVWRVTEALLAAARDEAHAASVPFLLVNAPASFEVYPEDWQRVRVAYNLPASGWDLDGPSRRLAEIAARRDLAYLDLRSALREAAPTGPRLYYFNDRHWTVAGHEVVAHALARAVADKRLLDGRAQASSPAR
jgi:hypothetical protein